MRAFIFAATLAFCASPALAQDYRLQAAAASELQAMCGADSGQLWGASLCAPLIVVDQQTRQAWATQRAGAFTLTPNGGWVGVLPEGAPIANTTVDWAGTRWVMVIGPLPEDATSRRVLVAHEAWHRAQSSIGLAMQNANAAHLETERGRYLMRLELRALATAMLSNGRARRNAAKDALNFRMARLASFPQALTSEASLDRNEGLASYTGVRLGAGEQAHLFAARTLDDFDHHPSLARSYAYASGPAYGLLLDEFAPTWRTLLATWAPADLLVSPLRTEQLNARQLLRRAESYGGPQILIEERNRAETQRQLIAGLQTRFSGSRLELPLGQMQFEFDPNAVTPVEGLGTVYQTLTLRDVWGEFRAGGGALISPDFSRLTASQPGQDGLSGPGWNLSLASGYRISAPDPAGIVRPELIAPPPNAGRRSDN
ncbi:hypothetical protein [Candidatus Viadribacter manganicus]|uniref:Peptidase M48 domain-containing protein n=1 Tax=Candidatus Viadribacter manganicus TaxID=1759059 RepID=A0A1B1ADU5_9PROT|nr:hypothetical protein [Candidatus Viadribacter manganicus]ANP44725.1 hypothetical protein ATE48_01695 [Candidatus Viadribacter manganicus]